MAAVGRETQTALVLMSSAPSDRRRLDELEQVIANGQRTFLAVGRSLLEIRDLRLYLLSHPTFEAYCRARWGMSRQHAYRLMAASDMSPTGDIESERQARRLREVPRVRSSGEHWAALSGFVKTTKREFQRIEPYVVALDVPSHRRRSTAKHLRDIGTYLGSIALHLEEGLE